MEATQLTLVLRNGLGDDLTNVGVNVGTCAVQDPEADGGDPWVDGDILDAVAGQIVLTTCTNGAVGSRFKEEVNIFYTAGSLAHNVTGSLTARVE